MIVILLYLQYKKHTMVEIKVITRSLDAAKIVSESLLESRLAIKPFILKEGVEGSDVNYILFAQTRASLFGDVMLEVKSLIGDSLISIYSTPIVNMDWEQIDTLLKKNKTA